MIRMEHPRLFKLWIILGTVMMAGGVCMPISGFMGPIDQPWKTIGNVGGLVAVCTSVPWLVVTLIGISHKEGE